jgi:hypothetical protein
MADQCIATPTANLRKNMYSPIQDGIEKKVQGVCYAQAKPPSNLLGLVNCFWALKTQSVLAEDFFLHAIPDA